MALPLGWPAAPRDDAFIVTPSNARAAHLLEHWGAWPVLSAVLTGPRKSGRSLLARIFAAKSGGIIVDDAERMPEAQIFHAWNAAQESRRPLVIVADSLPPAWPVKLPDLRSRLAASTHVVIGAPDDALMRLLFTELFRRRGLDARPDLIDWLATRVERSHITVQRVVDALDQEALERRKRLTIPLARTVLAAAGIVTASPSLFDRPAS
ncbi:MAG: chromosomal replication initiator DnaA [Pseudomonadota bacterium]|nr:chromosomal replication initiator DnaA [Pseudomonadota bacterium]